MAFVEIKLDEASRKRVENALARIPKVIPRVMKNGVNRTLVPVKTQVAKEMKKELKLSSAFLKRSTYVKKATNQRWVGEVNIKDKRIPIMALSPRKTNAGITYNEIGQGRALRESAFKATMPSGKTSIFARKGPERLPIALQYSNSRLSDAVKNIPGILNRAMRTAKTKLQSNIDGQVKRELVKAKLA